jgi:hypothetical protein
MGVHTTEKVLWHMKSKASWVPAASSKGSEVSPGYLLQDGIVQGEMGDELLEPNILLLKLFESLRLVYGKE